MKCGDLVNCYGMATLLDNFYEGCSKAYEAQNQLDMEPLCA